MPLLLYRDAEDSRLQGKERPAGHERPGQILREHSMAGWIQVEGTGISYPVMKGDTYLYKDFEKEHSSSGTPFVEDYWTEDSPITLIYGHNMCMYKTMFNPLHKFKDEEFLEKHTKSPM